jgi:hypothetical protein
MPAPATVRLNAAIIVRNLPLFMETSSAASKTVAHLDDIRNLTP